MSRQINNEYIGKADGQAWFGRTYSLKFYDKYGQLMHEIYNDKRNHWDGLRIKFEIKQEAYYINQMAQINIYNLSGKTKRLLESAASVILSAGYELNTGIIYTGNIVNAYDTRQQPDYIFVMYCLDYQRQYTPVEITIKKGSTASDAIEQFAGVVQDVKFNAYNMKNLSTKPIGEDIHFPKMEYTQALNQLANILDLRIWVTNSEIYAMPRNMTSFPANTQTIELDYSKGMIGSPTFNIANTGISASSLLNHNLKPANLIKVKTLNPQVQVGGANYINFTQEDITRGVWIIQSVMHQGDSWDGQWSSTISGYTYVPLGRNVL